MLHTSTHSITRKTQHSKHKDINDKVIDCPVEAKKNIRSD